MNPIEFIRKNVVTQLVGEGFPEDVARGWGRGGGRSLSPYVSSQQEGSHLRRLPYSSPAILPIPHTKTPERGIQWKTR